ncbi:uncharacterized protein LOC106051000 isoform X2 [Biomphalaria glabrata]|uniref:Uncharacterized protein LOC106051000 isoform X2 n=1 Tax=Biomphalaria glabrata TaxID=6526 RepID=A0A9W2ZKL5_BIOGL|nr:uncharacterized protein LOC106051000 isoform X2 [Biomphalaria glabrata]
MPYIYTYLSSSYSWCFQILCPVIYLPAAMRGKLKEEAISYTNLGSDNPLSQLNTGKHFLSRVKKDWNGFITSIPTTVIRSSMVPEFANSLYRFSLRFFKVSV